MAFETKASALAPDVPSPMENLFEKDSAAQCPQQMGMGG